MSITFGKFSPSFRFALLPFLPELTAALSSLEKIAWVRLDDETIRFTVIPDTGSQVWAWVLRLHSKPSRGLEPTADPRGANQFSVNGLHI